MTDEKAREWLLGILRDECKAPDIILNGVKAKSLPVLTAFVIAVAHDEATKGLGVRIAKQIDTITFKALE